MAGKKSKPVREHPGRFDSGVRKFIEIPAPSDPSKNPFRRKPQNATPPQPRATEKPVPKQTTNDD